ncbi:hypothetical protein [Hymenobacter sp.]|uniref:hypothetical protein n=1 Tax=Hymenobacter sp. TaxID=1898978 RepID=UPI00286AD2F1|nr:hypothetical protein [Hymenobacter sp.]
MSGTVVTTAEALAIHTMVMLGFRYLYSRRIPAAFDRIMGSVTPPDLAAYLRFAPKALVAFVLLPSLVAAPLCLALLSDWSYGGQQLVLLPHWLHLMSDKRMLGFVRATLPL